MSRLIRNKKLIGSTSNDSSHIIYDPSDTSRSETTVKSELDRLNAGIPAVDVGTATTDWTDTETATSANQGASNYGTLNAMSPASTIKSLLGSIKSLLFGLSTQVTSLNTQLTGKVSKQDVANNLTTTTEGYVLDARQGKALKDTLKTKAPLGYTLAGYKVGTAAQSIPSGWSELLICVAYSSTIVQCIVPKGIYGAIYMGANISGWVGGVVVVNATSASINSMRHSGSLVTSSSTMYVYYK
jgi:hypothetical protein